MTRTTDEWEALLDGTTPGPWEVETSRIFPANEKNGDGGYIQEYWLHFDDYHDGIDCNSELIDHAPAAVAEVVRLRREIDGIRQFVERFPLVPPLVGTGSTEARAYEMQEKVRHALARILEGDTHDR